MTTEPQHLAAAESLPYELRIGVTGHRELANPDAVRLAVNGLLEQLHAIFSAASEYPFGPAGFETDASRKVLGPKGYVFGNVSACRPDNRRALVENL